MASERDDTKVQLIDVRLSYPHLFEPKAFGKGEGKPAYSASFLIPYDDKRGKQMLDACEDAIEAAKERLWGDKVPKVKRGNIAIRTPDDEEDPDDVKPEEEGMSVVAARNYKQPRVLDRDKTDLDESDGRPYGGCYVDAIVRFWAQDYEGTKRVNCSLEAVRFRRDGEPFGAAPVDPDEFEDLDPDEGGGRRSNRRRKDDEDGEDEGRSSRRRGRDRDDDDQDDDKGSRRSRRSRDDDEDDDRSSRRSKRSRDDDEEDDRSSRRRGRDRDEDRSEDDDDDRSPRRSKRSRDDDDDDRSSRRSRRDRDDDF